MSSNEENSILSNGDILMYHPVIDEEDEDLEDNIIVHDVINNKYREFRLEYNDEWDNLDFQEISSNDELLALDIEDNSIIIWQ